MIDLGHCAGKNMRSILPELPNTTAMNVSRWVPIWNDNHISLKQLLAPYTYVTCSEEPIYTIDTNKSPKEPYMLTLTLKWCLGQDKFDQEYIGLYTHGPMRNNPIYAQISFNCWLLNAFKLKLECNVTILMSQMRTATGNGIAAHGIRQGNRFHGGHFKARYAQLLIFIPRLWEVLKSVEEWSARRMVGKRTRLVLV